jgi:hypothetical protein
MMPTPGSVFRRVQIRCCWSGNNDGFNIRD